MLIPPLPAIMVEPSVRAALLEDLGRAGDLTTDAIVPAARWPNRSPRPMCDCCASATPACPW